MMKWVLGCLAFGLVQGDCWGMKKAKSDYDIFSQQKATSVIREWRFSNPVPSQEKAHARRADRDSS